MMTLPTPANQSLLSCVVLCSVLPVCSCSTNERGAKTADSAEATSAVDLQDLPYSHPQIKKELLQLTKAAGRFRDSDWHYVPWHVLYQPNDGSLPPCGALWGSRPDLKPHQDWTGRPFIAVEASAFSGTSPPHEGADLIGGFKFSGVWFPNPLDWGAALYYENRRPNRPAHADKKRLALYFHHPEHSRHDRGLVLVIPDGGYRKTKRFGGDAAKASFAGLEYHISVFVYRSDANWALLESAQSMRDAGLAALDELEAAVRREIASGEAVESVEDFSAEAVRAARHLKKSSQSHSRPIPARFQLSGDQKEELLQEALQELEQRRKLLRDHYREMYGTAKNLFPLVDGLQEP